MAGVRSDYERVLKQRNTLLKSAAMARRHGGRSMDLSTLDVWDQHLGRVGAELLAQRLDLIATLQPLADKAYGDVAPGGGPVALEYRSSVGEDVGPERTRDELYAQLIAALEGVRKQEIERGVTLVGPHRDDLLLGLRSIAGEGVRESRRVLELRAGSAAGQLRAVALRGQRAGAGAGRRLRRAGRPSP